MSRVVFRRIRIERLMAINSPYELRGLAPGVNIIHGPNASGKTTTARAIEALLWPRVAAPSGAILDAAAELGGEAWTIRLNSGRVDFERDGVPSDPIPAVPSDGRDRYRLWLPDLLIANDADFARRILIESSGGYDLRAAADAVLDARRPTTRRGPANDVLDAARRKRREAVAAAEALSAESESLAEMEARLATRAELAARASACRIALDRIDCKLQLDRAREAVERFDPVVARLHGDEAERVRSLRERITDASGKRATAEAAAAEAADGIGRLGLPDAVASGDLLERLAADGEELSRLDTAIENESRLQETSKANLAQAEKLFRHVNRARLAELDVTDLGDLSAAARSEEDFEARYRQLAAELELLPAGSPPADLDRLAEGATILRQWRASVPRDAHAGTLRRIALTAVGLAIFGAILVGVVGPTWLGVILLLAGLAAGLVLFRVPDLADERGDRERAFLRLGLREVPDEWDSATVDLCLADLDSRVAEGRRLEQAQPRRRQLELRLDDLERTRPAPDERMHALAERFGLTLPEDAVRFYWLVESLTRWQAANEAFAGAEEAVIAAFGMRQELLESANARLDTIGVERVSNARELKGAVVKLRRDLEAYRSLERELANARRDADRLAAEIERLESEAGAILARIGIDPDDEHRLTEWCGLVGAWRERAAERDFADRRLGQIEEEARRIPTFDVDFGTRPREVVAADLARLEEEAAALDQLGVAVGQLRNRIEAARTGHSVEEALAEEKAALDALGELRERDLRSAVGAALVDFVERETRREHRPRVFERANELLGSITRDAYQLRVDDAETGSFRAIDTRDGRGYSLDHLSSGTRVQLLLAVRLAFVESLESGVALPLLLDETLANSDAERAAAMMDAVIRLAETGRQVFYFTAQADEVARWARALDAAEVEWTRIDLAEVRALDGRVDPEILLVAPPAPPAPAFPANVTHLEIPGHIPIPAVDPAAPAAALHPWYLVEDLDVLRFVIADLRVANWGQLRSMLERAGDSLLEPAVRERLFASAAAADLALTSLRIGRGRKVDRQALIESGAVTDRFIDQVEALCGVVDGDSGQLLDQLASGAVPRFRAGNVEALRDFLAEHGYLDERPRLKFEEIRHVMLAARAGDLAAGRVKPADLEALLTRIALGAGITLERPVPPQAVAQAFLWPEASAS